MMSKTRLMPQGSAIKAQVQQGFPNDSNGEYLDFPFDASTPVAAMLTPNIHRPSNRSSCSSIPLHNSNTLSIPTPLLNDVIEGLMDGVLILTENARVLCCNRLAQQICDRFCDDTSGRDRPSRSPAIESVPGPIWSVCQSLMDSQVHHEQPSVMVEDEIHLDKTQTIRVRVRWLRLAETNAPYLLVILEDRLQSAKRRAILEGKRYGLTKREAEVWLYRCIEYTYEEIARELFITINTVKKHIKSINFKRDAFLARTSV